jgi:hypothetical protein
MAFFTAGLFTQSAIVSPGMLFALAHGFRNSGSGTTMATSTACRLSPYTNDCMTKSLRP